MAQFWASSPTYLQGTANPYPKQVSRLLKGAQRGITPIGAVLASSPTYAQGTVNANSTIIASATVDAPVYPVSNALYMLPIGGALQSVTATRWRPGGYTDIPSQNRRLSGHGSGIRFATYATTIGIVGDFRGTGMIIYVYDPATGTRVRTQAADYVPTTGLAENVITFSGRALRVIEVCAADVSAYYTGVNVPTTDSVWSVKGPDMSRVGVMWDSWGAGTGNGNTNPTKLTVLDYMGERLGVSNIFAPCVGGTGFIAPNNTATNLNYLQRLVAGDFDVSVVGELDAVIMPASLNDYVLSGNTSAATKMQAILCINALRAAQPNALMIGCGPQFTTSTGVPPQSWYDAISAAWASVADSNSIYLDNSPTGENWLFGTSSTGINSIVFTGTQNHVNDAGMAYMGYRMGDSILAAIAAKFGL